MDDAGNLREVARIRGHDRIAVRDGDCGYLAIRATDAAHGGRKYIKRGTRTSTSKVPSGSIATQNRIIVEVIELILVLAATIGR